MSLREQFEAYVQSKFTTKEYSNWMLEKDSSGEYFDEEVRNRWGYFQAGHAASGREELLEACEAMLAEVCVWEEHHGTHPDADRARAAIKKARGEQ